MTTRQQMIAKRRKQQRANNILFAAGGLLVLIAIVLLFSNKSGAQQAVEPVEVGKPLADFSLPDINGETVKLSDYAGKVVLINAWATWCPPCIAEMPDLHAYYQEHQDEGFVILAINGGESASTAAAFASQKGLTFPVLVDPTTSFLTSLGISSYPTSILVGADGVVKAVHLGMFTPQALEDEVTPYLQD